MENLLIFTVGIILGAVIVFLFGKRLEPPRAGIIAIVLFIYASFIFEIFKK